MLSPRSGARAQRARPRSTGDVDRVHAGDGPLSNVVNTGFVDGIRFVRPLPRVSVRVTLAELSPFPATIDFVLDTGATATTIHPMDMLEHFRVLPTHLIDPGRWRRHAGGGGLEGVWCPSWSAPTPHSSGMTGRSSRSTRTSTSRNWRTPIRGCRQSWVGICSATSS